MPNSAQACIGFCHRYDGAMGEFTSQTFDADDLIHAQGAAVRAAAAVAPTLRSHFNSNEYEAKEDPRSWVTGWDYYAQERIIDEITERFDPSIPFKAEEDNVTTDQEVYWTVDPIDGTSHYVRGIENCTTMIALVDHGVPVVAVINDFIRWKLFYARAGSHAAAIPTTSALHDTGYFSTPFVSERPIDISYLELYTDETKEKGLKLRQAIEASGAYLFRTSAMGQTLTSIASGQTEGFVSVDNPFHTEWDVAPGALLIHAAGGIVRNVGEEDFNLKKPNFIAANKVVFDSLAQIVQQNA